MWCHRSVSRLLFNSQWEVRVYTTADKRAQHGQFQPNKLQRHIVGTTSSQVPHRALHSIFGLLFMLMRCCVNERWDKQLTLGGPLGPACRSYKANTKTWSLAADTLEETVRRAAGVALSHLTSASARLPSSSSASLPPIQPINTHFFFFKGPLLHDLPLSITWPPRGGCHGNTTHRSRLPSLFP